MATAMRHTAFLILWIVCTFSARGQTFDILKDEDQVTIPFEYKHNFIVLDVVLEETLPLHFIFDTGAEHTLLFKQVYANILELEYDGSLQIVGSDLNHNLRAWISRSVGLQVPPLEQVQSDLLILNRDYLYLDELMGTHIDGVLGANFFHDHIVRIDYKNREITLYKPDAFNVPNKHFIEFPLTIRRSKPYMNFQLNTRGGKSVPVELLIDSGAGISIVLHSNTHTDIEMPDSTILGQVGAGLGGYLSGYMGKIHSLAVDDDITFRDLVVSFQDLDSLLVASRNYLRNGLIGNVLLSRFEVIIDYPRNRILLDPERKYNRSFKYDRSGLVIFATGTGFDQYVVRGVIPGSPAEEAGIRPGDHLKRFQWFPASWYSLEGIMRRLKKRGDKKIRVVLIRNGKKIKKSFRLRDLF